MKDFARLFKFEDIGQVLVTLDQSEETSVPEIKISFNGGEGLGVCAVKFSFKDTDAGWLLAEKEFEEVSEKKAYEVAKDVLGKFESALAEED